MMIMSGGWRVSQWLVLLIRDRVMACGDTATLTLPLPLGTNTNTTDHIALLFFYISSWATNFLVRTQPDFGLHYHFRMEVPCKATLIIKV